MSNRVSNFSYGITKVAHHYRYPPLQNPTFRKSPGITNSHGTLTK
jgi:hypothetical protein